MFERFNEHVRRSLFFARYEASRTSSRSIGSEHLLLGMLREADPAFSELLDETGRGRARASGGAARRSSHAGTGEHLAGPAAWPKRPRRPSLLRFTRQRAWATRASGSEHLLLGLLRAEDCTAAQYLNARRLRALRASRGGRPARPRARGRSDRRRPRRISPSTRAISPCWLPKGASIL